MASLTDTDKLLRTISEAMYGETKFRIHNEGQRATGAPIGQYSPEYMKLRTNTYASNTITRGKNIGQTRPAYNRTSDTKIIFSLTTDMENNYKVIAISDTEYGLGFDNPTDAQKSVWLAERFGNDIWALSESELEQVNAIVQEFVNNAFK
jgi:hypothetical protein